MMKILNKKAIILLLVLILPVFLTAGVTATYVGEPAITLRVAPGPFTHPTVLGAKLGTFILTSSTGVIYSPAMVNIGEASGATPLTGLMKNWATGPYSIQSNDFYIITAAYPNGLGSEPVLEVLYNNVRPVISWGATAVYANPFYIELYLVNTNNRNRHAQSLYRQAAFFKLDTPYTLPSGFNPLFSVAVANNASTNVGSYTHADGTVNESHGSYVESNGVGGADNTQIINPGSYTNPDNPGQPGFFYGDAPLSVSFVFSFLNPQTSFTLSDAFGSNRTTINEARIEVLNAAQGSTFELLLTFTDTSAAPSFQLFPTTGAGSPINYSLLLDNTFIEKGVAVPWAGLQPGPANNKNIRITGISEAEVLNKVSGDYRGTITVTITNPN